MSAKHRAHVKSHFACDPWEIEIRGHTALVCPQLDSNQKNVYYRGYWFIVIIDSFIIFSSDTQEDLFKRLDDVIREEIEKYIDENHIVFKEE